MEEILHTFGIEWKLLLFQLLNFGLVVLVLYKFLYKPVLAIIAKRQALIEKGVADAKEAEETLALADKNAEALEKAAREEADKTIHNAKKIAEDEAALVLRKEQEQAQKMLREAKAEAERQKEEAIRAAEKEVAKLSILAAEKILREEAAK